MDTKTNQKAMYNNLIEYAIDYDIDNWILQSIPSYYYEHNFNQYTYKQNKKSIISICKSLFGFYCITINVVNSNILPSPDKYLIFKYSHVGKKVTQMIIKCHDKNNGYRLNAIKTVIKNIISHE